VPPITWVPLAPHLLDFDPSMLFTFLLVVQAIIAAMLVTVILMQQSEGGGLTSGGSPSGLMSARGAANFLTRSTAVLAGLFIAMSILLAVMAATRQADAIDTSLARPTTAAPATGPAPAQTVDPLDAAAGAVVANQAAPVGNSASEN
jgi:preprotein translocase subunit SecG